MIQPLTIHQEVTYLKDAHAMLFSEGSTIKWGAGALAYDSAGRVVDVRDEGAVRMCFLGAVGRLMFDSDPELSSAIPWRADPTVVVLNPDPYTKLFYTDIFHILPGTHYVLREMGYGSVFTANDSCTHAGAARARFRNVIVQLEAMA